MNQHTKEAAKTASFGALILAASLGLVAFGMIVTLSAASVINLTAISTITSAIGSGSFILASAFWLIGIPLAVFGGSKIVDGLGRILRSRASKRAEAALNSKQPADKANSVPPNKPARAPASRQTFPRAVESGLLKRLKVLDPKKSTWAASSQGIITREHLNLFSPATQEADAYYSFLTVKKHDPDPKLHYGQSVLKSIAQQLYLTKPINAECSFTTYLVAYDPEQSTIKELVTVSYKAFAEEVQIESYTDGDAIARILGESFDGGVNNIAPHIPVVFANVTPKELLKKCKKLTLKRDSVGIYRRAEPADTRPRWAISSTEMATRRFVDNMKKARSSSTTNKAASRSAQRMATDSRRPPLELAAHRPTLEELSRSSDEELPNSEASSDVDLVNTAAAAIGTPGFDAAIKQLADKIIAEAAAAVAAAREFAEEIDTLPPTLIAVLNNPNALMLLKQLITIQGIKEIATTEGTREKLFEGVIALVRDPQSKQDVCEIINNECFDSSGRSFIIEPTLKNYIRNLYVNAASDVEATLACRELLRSLMMSLSQVKLLILVCSAPNKKVSEYMGSDAKDEKTTLLDLLLPIIMGNKEINSKVFRPVEEQEPLPPIAERMERGATASEALRETAAHGGKKVSNPIIVNLLEKVNQKELQQRWDDRQKQVQQELGQDELPETCPAHLCQETWAAVLPMFNQAAASKAPSASAAPDAIPTAAANSSSTDGSHRASASR